MGFVGAGEAVAEFDVAHDLGGGQRRFVQVREGLRFRGRRCGQAAAQSLVEEFALPSAQDGRDGLVTRTARLGFLDGTGEIAQRPRGPGDFVHRGQPEPEFGRAAVGQAEETRISRCPVGSGAANPSSTPVIRAGPSRRSTSSAW